MARFADSEVERLKAQVSTERLVTSAGVALDIEGDGLVGRCPFCQAGEGLVVSPGPNLWRCRACDAGGSVVDWVMAAEGVSVRHALELLSDGFEPTVLKARPPVTSPVTKLDAPFSPDLTDAELLVAVVGFYGRALAGSPEALGYLAERKIGAGAVEAFGLGFADRTLGLRLPESFRVAGGELRGRLKGLGVFRADSGHEHFNGSVVVPIVDGDGAVVQVYGRKVGSKLRRGTALHLWLPGGAAGVWNLGGLAGGEVIVCESLFDALTFWSAGFENVTATAGPDGFGEDHYKAFADAGVTRVLFAFDNDVDGERGATSVAPVLSGDGVECFRCRLPAGSDVNDVACRAKSPADALGSLVRHAEWMGKGSPPRRQKPVVESGPRSGSAVGPGLAAVPDDVDQSAEAPPTGGVAPADKPGPVVAGDLDEIPDSDRPDPDGPGDDGDEAGGGPVAVSVVPPGPDPDVVPVVVGDELVVVLGDRRWRVRGLAKNTTFDVLRVNVMVSLVGGDGFHIDVLDLYAARARGAFIAAAAGELRVDVEVVKRDLGRVLFVVEAEVDRLIGAAQEPAVAPVVLDAEERDAALELLRDPDLVGRLVADFAKAGVVGEATNCVVGFLAATSRLLGRPLAVIIQSTSAAGKSQLMDAVLSFIPPEGLVSFSAMTGQSLYYLGDRDLAHKVLAIAEEEGASKASYALKLLQSEGEVSIASTGKDNTSGRLVTHEYRVCGPTAIFLTTTAIDVDEELLNRCLVLTVDEDRAQTRAIHDRQRQAHTLAGVMEGQARDTVRGRWRDAQRLLEPVTVVNPFADRLGFADSRTRTRRDHVKYLTLIEAVTLLHQHQRPRREATVDGRTVTYIEATVADIALANRLAHDVLGHSLDELPPQTRRLLIALDKLVEVDAADRDVGRGDVRFTRRRVRGRLGWSDFQVRTHLGRLVDLEYVLVHRGGRGQSFVYELLWDGADDGDRHLPGLVDITPDAADGPGYDAKFEGQDVGFEGPTGPHRGPFERGSSTTGNGDGPGRPARNGPEPPDHVLEGDGDGDGVVVVVPSDEVGCPDATDTGGGPADGGGVVWGVG